MTKRTAVVIDDEVDITNYLSSILETNGFEVRAANDAKSGEVLIRESPPDVVGVVGSPPTRLAAALELVQIATRTEHTPGTGDHHHTY